MNLYGVRAIYLYGNGADRTDAIPKRGVAGNLDLAVFIVFGAAIGSRITQIGGVSYGSFIVPGLIMLMPADAERTNASFGIYFPVFVGTIYEILSAPISSFEIVIGLMSARRQPNRSCSA